MLLVHEPLSKGAEEFNAEYGSHQQQSGGPFRAAALLVRCTGSVSAPALLGELGLGLVEALFLLVATALGPIATLVAAALWTIAAGVAALVAATATVSCDGQPSVGIRPRAAQCVRSQAPVPGSRYGYSALACLVLRWLLAWGCPSRLRRTSHQRG